MDRNMDDNRQEIAEQIFKLFRERTNKTADTSDDPVHTFREEFRRNYQANIDKRAVTAE